MNYRLTSVLLIILVGLIAYSNTLDYSFHFDDLHTIVKNTSIRDVKNVEGIWNFNYHSKLRFIGFYTFALTYHFVGTDVFLYHAGNIFIHILAALSLYWFVLLLPQIPYQGMSAFLCSLIFVAHPIQTQAVTYLCQRFTCLMALFYLLTLCFFIKARGGGNKLLYVFGFFTGVLAMFTKEEALTLPFAILLLEVLYFKLSAMKAIIGVAIAGVAGFGMLFFTPSFEWRDISMNIRQILYPVGSDRAGDPLLTPLVYGLTQPKVILNYLSLIILPIRQTIDHDVKAGTGIAEMVILALGGVGVVYWVNKTKNVLFGVLGALLVISVTSTIKPLRNVMFEHRVYLPLAFLLIAVVPTVLKCSYKKGVNILLIAGLVFMGWSNVRNEVWKDDLTLWADAVRKSPLKARTHNNYGHALFISGDIDGAIGEYAQSLTIYPDSEEIRHNLQRVLAIKGLKPGTYRIKIEKPY